MDKLEIKQGSFIQQTQYFIPVELDLSVVPARLRIRFFHLSRRTRTLTKLKLQSQKCFNELKYQYLKYKNKNTIWIKITAMQDSNQGRQK
jgi:hypothetical protein